MARVLLDHVTKRFGDVEAVKKVYLQINDGSFTVLVGPSGCGKTTTLRLIAGLEKVTKGRIFIGDREVTHLEPKDRNVAMVFQNYALYPHLKVYDNIAFGLKAAKKSRKEIKCKVYEVAEMLGIKELLNRKPHQLSGGQQQRVAIGRAIVRNPNVFLFDEPLSNLDAKLRIAMRTELVRLHRKLKTTTIYVTHDQEEAMTLASEIVVMNQGQIMQIGSPWEIYHRPQNIFVAGFIGSPEMNFLQGEYTNGVFSFNTPDARVKVKLDLPFKRPAGKVTIGFRPNDVYLTGTASADISSPSIEALVDIIELLGSHALLTLSLGQVQLKVLLGEQLLDQVKEGEKVRIILDQHRLHIFDPETGNRLN